MSGRDGGISRGSSVSAISGAPSSQGSGTGGGEPQVNVDELTDDQILSLVNETAQAVDRLQMETVMFERYYDKLGGGGEGGASRERRESGASSTEGSQIASASGSLLDVSPQPGGRRKSTVSSSSRRKSSGSRTDPRGRQIRLTVKQKCGIASKEVVFATAELAKVRLGSRVQLEQARAGAEERLMRLADVEATVADFNAKVVKGAVHERFGSYQAEKVVRWLEDQAKSKGKHVERLRIETAGLRAKIRAVTRAAQLCAEKGEDEGDQVIFYLDQSKFTSSSALGPRPIATPKAKLPTAA